MYVFTVDIGSKVVLSMQLILPNHGTVILSALVFVKHEIQFKRAN